MRGTGLRVDLALCGAETGTGDGEIVILAREVIPPLVLRSKRKGDEILLEGGAASIKELLAGWRGAEGDREKIPILVDRKGVLAVLGGALGYRTRARAGVLAVNGEDANRFLIRIRRDMEEGCE